MGWTCLHRTSSCAPDAVPRSVQEVVSETVKLALILGGILGGGLLFGGGPALRAFTSDPDAIAAATPLLPLVALSQPINALAFVWDGE